MTKAELDLLPFEDQQKYFEEEYPYVFPENEVMDILDPAMISGYSVMERAYVQWMVETNNTEIAVEQMIHPAVYFDKENFGKKYLRGKRELTELVRKIRRECPYLKLYTADYLTGLLHAEVQHLRSRTRKDRFSGPNMDLTKLVGKKSPHDQEMEEIDRLLACLKQIQELKTKTAELGGTADASTSPQQSDIDSSIDRVIAGTKALINHREASESGRIEGDPAEPAPRPVVSANGTTVNGVHM